MTLPDAGRRVVIGLIPIVCPPEVEPMAVSEAIADHVAASLGALARHVRAGVLAGLMAYDIGGLARHGRRAHKLDRDRGGRYYRTWLHTPGPMHEFAKGIKGLICLAYYELPEVQASMGYDPAAWIAEVDARRQARYAEAIDRHAEALRRPDPLGLPVIRDPKEPVP